ncbi:QsdR family transcriptional regulator [Paractinoplanes atraurantiacus]|uniref:QsdR family transcriptional regulator n=1 Tax=Paractinoplanes atraurantiacus TaxID=1036182 RepID=UPI000BE3E863|nr:QsdR family transcriptional regulator [Actinoplanes atraurantiacus]
MESRRVVSDDEVTRAGCRFFLAHGTVEMSRLAEDMCVSRATLYRITHSRDRLLGDVLWRLAERMLADARRECTATGAEGVLEVTRRFTERLLAAEPFRRFLTAEPEVAARVLMTGAGRVTERVVAAQHEIFREAGLPEATDDLAYLYVRIIESALYGELVDGRNADLALAERVLKEILRQLSHDPR